jgi:multiple sugar transport system ATP-binding protein
VTHDQIEAMTLADRIVVMNARRIEQQGTPLELYRKPDNLFVAGFIGSPAMSFLEAVADTSGEAPAARLSDGTLIQLSQTLRLQPGQPITVGLRPEHLTPGESGTRLAGTTRLVEPTGAQTHVVFELSGQPVTSIVDGAYPAAFGAPFEARIGPESIHVFDRDTGASIAG